jgi:hypothetical protein
MKKLIKLLFPKTYQAIITEGYNQAYNNYNEDYNRPEHDYYDYNEQYNQDELQRLHDELQRLHDEHYDRIAEEEYQLELTRMYEEDCKGEQQELIKLYTPKQPLLSVGDKIHLHSKQGMYTVTKAFEYSFAYRTRDSIDDSYADYNDYKCHAGGRWNNRGV